MEEIVIVRPNGSRARFVFRRQGPFLLLVRVEELGS